MTESSMVAVGDVIGNLGLAPRDVKCWICKNVRASEDVTARTFDPSGQRQETTEAVAYLISIGVEGTKLTLQRRVLAHAKHIEAFRSAPYPLVPGKPVIRVDLPHADWLSATNGAVALGMEAQRSLAVRLLEGDMKDKDVIALARLGIVSGFKQGDLEAKGKSLKQVDRLLMLAAGLPQDVIDGEAREVE